MVVIAFVTLKSNGPFLMLPVLGTALIIAGKEGWVNRAILSTDPSCTSGLSVTHYIFGTGRYLHSPASSTAISQSLGGYRY